MTTHRGPHRPRHESKSQRGRRAKPSTTKHVLRVVFSVHGVHTSTRMEIGPW